MAIYYGTDDSDHMSADPDGSTLYGLDGNDYLFGGAGDDALIGGNGNDVLYGNGGNDSLSGGNGDDHLYGGAGDDYLYGGSGDDALTGGEGDDTYEFGRGDGHDVITETSTVIGEDSVILRGLNPSDVELFIRRRPYPSSNSDLIIRIKDTGETLTVGAGLSHRTTQDQHTFAVEWLRFADGTVWGLEEILSRPLHMVEDATSADAVIEGSFIIGNDLDNTIYGDNGNDRLYGGAGDDSLSGGAGNDYLYGGSGDDDLRGGGGNDIYEFGRGDGHDTITETSTEIGEDSIVLRGLNPEDVELFIRRRPSPSTSSDLIIRIKDTGETLTVVAGLSHKTTQDKHAGAVEWLRFEDGAVWGLEEILSRPLHMLESETRADAVVDGSFIVGNDLDNTITGSKENDILHGGAGDDTLNGGAGDDYLYGGSGNDDLRGGAGDDTYEFGRGDGNDSITETGGQDTIFLRDLNPEDIMLFIDKRSGSSTSSDFIIRIKGTGETLTVVAGLSNSYTQDKTGSVVESIRFGNGTAWTLEDILSQPMYMLDDKTSVKAVPEGSFIIGNDLDNTMTGGAGNDILHGGAGNDTLTGGAGDDVLWGGTGDDSLQGGAGNDTYLFNLGDGSDTIKDTAGDDSLLFGDGIGADDLWFSKSGTNLIINVIGTDDKVTVGSWFSGTSYKVETISAGGMDLVSTQMDQLIQSLASFGAPAGVDGQWTQEQKEGVQAVISGYWRPSGS